MRIRSAENDGGDGCESVEFYNNHEIEKYEKLRKYFKQ